MGKMFANYSGKEISVLTLIIFMLVSGLAFVLLTLIGFQTLASLLFSILLGSSCALSIIVLWKCKENHTSKHRVIIGLCGGLLIGISILVSIYFVIQDNVSMYTELMEKMQKL